MVDINVENLLYHSKYEETGLMMYKYSNTIIHKILMAILWNLM